MLPCSLLDEIHAINCSASNRHYMEIFIGVNSGDSLRNNDSLLEWNKNFYVI